MTFRKLVFYTDDPDGLQDRAILSGVDEPDLTLGRLLAEHSTVLSVEQLTQEHLNACVKDLDITASRPQPDRAGYPVPGLGLGAAAAADVADLGPVSGAAIETAPWPDPQASPEPSVSGTVITADLARHPDSIRDREAVVLAYEGDIARAASYLECNLSVLIRCEKILVSHLSEEIAVRAGGVAKFIRLDPQVAKEKKTGSLLDAIPASRRTELMEALLAAVAAANPGELLVIPNLDLLAGGNDSTLSGEARELAEALYEKADSVLLAFCDPSLTIPEVLASRFAVRLAIDLLPRQVVAPDGRKAPTGRALVTQAEADLFAGYDEVGLYKHVAGLNAIQLRHGLQFAASQYRPPSNGPALKAQERPTFRQLIAELQTFKVKTSSSFEVPNVSWDAIGGYQGVKEELDAAIEIIDGAGGLPEHLRTELVPAGFIFHGPPGTGKTLFAKAVASRLAATIMVVSGPEITDKYVGESERKIRELFADARRNAPSVVVFDEFDSIAAQRTGRDDGGARAGNAVVAQLLTELDGFRPDVPVLIIGTTNRLDLIDEALLRPSRFRPIHIGPPDRDARREIAAYHAHHFGIDVSAGLLDRIAAATDQFSGDDIRSLFRDARAGELTGKRVMASPYRLGEIVGRLRRTRQLRELQRSGITAAPPVTADGHRQRLSDQASGAVRRRPFDRGAAEAAHENEGQGGNE